MIQKLSERFGRPAFGSLGLVIMLALVAIAGAAGWEPVTSIAAAAALLPAAGPPRLPREPEGARDEGAWRVLPLEGRFEIVYYDALGNPSIRHVSGRELKIGPGKTLLGGIDAAAEAYRGFRADRIERIRDTETGEAVDRNIIDWLIRRAMPSRRARKGAHVPKSRRERVRDAEVDSRGGARTPL